MFTTEVVYWDAFEVQAWWMMSLRPSRYVRVVARPCSFMTRTLTIFASGATPTLRPAIREATPVPCELAPSSSKFAKQGAVGLLLLVQVEAPSTTVVAAS